MIHKNISGWNMPTLQDGDIIIDSQLKGVTLPMVKLHFIDSNLKDVTLIDGLHTQEGCAIGTSLPEQEPEPMQDIELAAKAELVLQSLIASGKLSAEMITVLNGLMDGVKQSANVDNIETGLAATMQTTEIIERLRQQGNNELASQIEQALSAVQAIWEAK